MSIKTKALAAKNKTVTFFKKNAVPFITGAALGVAGGTYLVIRELVSHMDTIDETINQHAEVGNFERSHPWFLEKNEDGSFSAQRVALAPEVVDPPEKA